MKKYWGSRARAIVLYPELEAWVWSDSRHVDDILGWKNKKPKLREWLEDENWIDKGDSKPDRPKEAFEAALKEVGMVPSARLFKRLASKVSVKRCSDKSFLEFKKILKEWFP